MADYASSTHTIPQLAVEGKSETPDGVSRPDGLTSKGKETIV